MKVESRKFDESKQKLREDYESGIEEFDKLCQEIALFFASLNTRPALNLEDFIGHRERISGG